MRASEKLRAIYVELRAAAGEDAAAGDLLRLAHVILLAFFFEPNEVNAFGRVVEHRAFFALPVDTAMEGGGWKVLNFETERAFHIDELEEYDLIELKTRVTNLLGPEWLQRTPQE